FSTQGIHFFDYQTGERTDWARITGASALLAAKGAALGDIEAECAIAPIEIGNYVWEDTDADGIQDACESGITGVNVTLYDLNGDSLTTVQTDANGEYYFNNDTPGLDTLLPNTMYFIVVGEAEQFDIPSGNLSLAGTEYSITLDSIGEGSFPRQNDSDGTIANGIDPDFDGQPYVKITTNNSGNVNHTFDFGFISCSVTASVIAGDQTICLGADPMAFTVNTSATGNGTLTYQWQNSTTDCTSGFNDINGATAEIYDEGTVNATTYYRLIVTNTNGSTVCRDTSNCLTITVEDPIQITAATQNCEDNGTGGLDTDDYFSITFTATSTNPGATNEYAVYNGAELLASGITYGNTVTLEWANAAMNQRFSADNSSIYTLTIQDLDNNSCTKNIMTTAQPSCSTCPAQICLPVTIDVRRTTGSR
ncbi:MAG: SdrD B-like domain-containing protein, partial [Saprospiraceae bacterium]